ncbi:MAG: nucleotidyltransferase family protein [bacterium]
MDRETAIRILKAHQRELNDLGVEHASLFGSVARGESTPDSDVDIAIRFAPEARPSLINLVRVERTLSGWFHMPVDVVKEPARKPELQDHIDRDGIRAF